MTLSSNFDCVCAENTEAGLALDEHDFPVECRACATDKFALQGGRCECKAGTFLVASSQKCSASSEDTCVVNRRLPPFAFRPGHRVPSGAAPLLDQGREAPRLASGFGSAPPPSASRSPGGVCHMGRLAMVENTALQDSSLSHALQLCAQAPGSEGLTCTALEQRPAKPADSRSVLLGFGLVPNAATPSRARALGEPHARRLRCSSCDAQAVDSVVSRLANAEPEALAQGAPRQLSVGEPVRLSAERVVATKLRRELCGPPGAPAGASCRAALERAVQTSSSSAEDLRHGKLLRALLREGRPSTATASAQNAQKGRDAREEAERALWARPWVFCPHSKDAEAGGCTGSVDRATWLDPARRPGACAEKLAEAPRDYAAPVHFCLLSKDTESLCDKMLEWREHVRGILCRAAGACPYSEFFYTPTTFDLQSQEFVFDSVSRYYKQDANLTCADPTQDSRPPDSEEQIAVNEDAAARCASTTLQPLVEALEGARIVKKAIVLVAYFFYRMLMRLVQLLVALAREKFSGTADDALNLKNKAIANLVMSCRALIESLSNLVEAATSAFMELFMSKGMGGWIKSMMLWICKLLKFIINELWVPVLCPIVHFVLSIAHSLIKFLTLLT